jgi:putative cell wall-binding protein
VSPVARPLLVACLVAACLAPAATASTAAGRPVASRAGTMTTLEPVVHRIAGPDRYATAVALLDSAAEAPPPGGLLVLASGGAFPDALAGGPVAGANDGPLLLVPSVGTVPSAVLERVGRLDPAVVVVMGGTAAVSDGVVSQVRHAAPDAVIDRVDGANRYDTAAQASDYLYRVDGQGSPVPPRTAVLASGEGFADALAGGALGGWLSGPLLLSRRDSLPPETAAALSEIDPLEVEVLGGPAAVSTAVEDQVKALLPGANVVRLAGRDRYATAARIASRMWPQASNVYLASGQTFPDALSVAPLAAQQVTPVLLTKRDCVPAVTRDWMAAAPTYGVTVVGGTAAVSEDAAALTVC